MANLYGTGISQIPTNGMLGNLAFQDKAYVSVDRVGIGSTFVDSGTANQILQVYGGGAYVSGSVGIGSTNPQEKLDVQGGNGFVRIGEVYAGYNGITLNNSTTDNDYNVLSSPSDKNLYLNRPTAWSMNFRVGNADQMVLNPSGNLGINSAAPTSRLDVVGDAKVLGVSTFTAANTSAVVVRSGASGSYTALDIGRNSGDFSIGIAAGGGQFATDSVAGDAIIRSNSGKILLNIAGGTSSLAIAGNNVLVGTATSTGTASQALQVNSGAYVSGSVGIGTTNPGAKLEVTGDIRVSANSGSFRTIGAADSSNTTLLLQSGAASGIGGNIELGRDQTNSYDANIHQFRNVSAGSEYARINGNGHLLISSITDTGTASQRLQVTGGAYISARLGIGQTNPNTALHIGPYNGDTLPHLYLSSGNNAYGWRIDTQDFNGGSVPLRIWRRVGEVDTESITVLNQSGFIGLGITLPGARLHATPTSTAIAGLFSGTTSDDMVRITQLGTGNALRVEDEANPDSSPFVITGIGSVGIGTTNPGTNKLQVQGTIKATLSIDTDTQFLGQPNDTVSTPSFSWTSDTTTGFYRPSSGNLGFTISGTERLRLNTTGVGIGTTNPITKLHISDGNGGISTALYTSDYLAISAQNTSPGFNIIAAGSGTVDRGVFKATRARGTLSSPTVPLTNDNTFSLLGAIYDGSIGRATAAINMDVDGDVGVGTAPQRITFWTGTDSSRIERARITSTGNVGIGTTDPTSKLTVEGDALITGILTARTGLGGDAFESYEIDLIPYTTYNLRTEEQTITFTDTNDTTTNSYLWGTTTTLPIEDNSLIEDSTFVPYFNGEVVSIVNPFKLMITVNGVLQSAFINNTDYVYQSNILGSHNGYTIDSDNNIKFTESIPTGSDIVARVLPVSSTATKIKNYPFKPTDIVLGY